MKNIIVLAFLCAILFAGVSFGDAYTINFDQVMLHVWTQSGIWTVVQNYNVLQDTFTLDPEYCDINGGFDISQTPVILYPNQILDSDEYALVAAILANPNFDCTATGGTSHQQIHDAWNKDYAQAWHDLGGGVGGPQLLLPPNAMIPDVEYLFSVMMIIGDNDTVAFPLMIMDLVVNNADVRGIIRDPNLHVPDPGQYALMYPYLGWCGDADGDGCSNLSEYQYYYPDGGRAAYLAAAMDPNVHPPDCTGERMCDGTGGLHGEYFGTRYMTDLKATRLDHQISFDWGDGKPHPDVAADNFSVCWTGLVTARYSEAYTFSVRTDDGVRLWVNNELLVDQWNDHGPTTYTGTTSTALVAGQSYPIRMDFYENGGGAVAWLGWESASQPHKAIYEMYLTPGNGIGDRRNDWIRNPNNGHFYKLTPELPWTAGSDLAVAWQAYPCTIDNAEENEWIRLMFGPAIDMFFFGGNDIASEGRWVWPENGANFWNGAAGGSVVAPWYANWASGEPNDANGEDVAQFYCATGKWNDLPTTRVLRMLAESSDGRINYTGPVPVSATTFPGSRHVIRVEVQHPTGAVTYQWKQDGEPIPGATNSYYEIRHATSADDGAYTCVISDESPATVETGAANFAVFDAWQLPTVAIPGLLCLAIATLFLGAMQVIRTQNKARVRQ